MVDEITIPEADANAVAAPQPAPRAMGITRDKFLKSLLRTDNEVYSRLLKLTYPNNGAATQVEWIARLDALRSGKVR